MTTLLRLFVSVCLFSFTETAASAQTAGADIPDTAAGHQLEWLLTSFNDPSYEFTPGIIEDHFGPLPNGKEDAAYLAYEFQLMFKPNGPFSLGSVAEGVTSNEISAYAISRYSSEFMFILIVEPAAPFRITDFRIAPVTRSALSTTETQDTIQVNVPQIETWEDFDSLWQASAEQSSFLAAEVTDSGCETIHALEPELELNVGRTADLYLLGQSTRLIESGWSWDGELEIRDELKGVPPFDMGSEAEGERFSVEQFADAMMAGDRTASDHLNRYLNRDLVEAGQTEMGHSNPELNTPFLTSRENFTLKVSASEEARNAYATGSPVERKTLLATEIDQMPVERVAGQSWLTPRSIEQIGWFASVDDLCDAMRYLRDQSEKPGLEPVSTILQIDHAMSVDPQTYPVEWFVTSGEEPGIVNVTWMLQRDDGRWFFISGTLNDSTQPIIEEITLVLLQSATLLSDSN